MNYKLFLVYFYLYFLYIRKSNCEDIFKCQSQNHSNNFINDYINSYLSPKFSPLNDNNLHYKTNSKFYPKEIKKTINPRKVESILLFKEEVYILNVDSSNYNIENDLLIYFYPLDCKIQITGEFSNDGKEIAFEKISNYENDVFYTKIKKDKLNETYIIINTLIF